MDFKNNELEIKPKEPRIWHGNKRYHNYNHSLRKQFGEPVYKISLHGDFTCPNRDGTKGYGGCIYCNNDSFVPRYISPDMAIAQQMEASIPFFKDRYGVKKFIAYFQAYSNTYAEIEYLKELYETAINYPGIVGLDIGTRSDCVDERLLEYLAKLNEKVPVTLEYGIESIHDETLVWMNRGHDFKSLVNTVELTQKYGLQVGGHVIMGFPVESREMMLETGIIANELKLNFLKFHQLHIVKNTTLAKMYRDKPWRLFDPDEYIDLVVDIMEKLDPEITIQRVFGDTPPALLIAPNWNLNIPKLQHLLDLEFKRRESWQGKYYDKT